MNRPMITLLIGVFALATPAAAQNENFRCGEKIIENGDSQARVLEYCGEPTDRNGDYWTYQREGKFTVVVQFKYDGTVYRIQEK